MLKRFKSMDVGLPILTRHHETDQERSESEFRPTEGINWRRCVSHGNMSFIT